MAANTTTQMVLSHDDT